MRSGKAGWVWKAWWSVNSGVVRLQGGKRKSVGLGMQGGVRKLGEVIMKKTGGEGM